jgi:hypothetical protein
VFEPHEIIRCYDYDQTHHPPGRLDVEISEDKKEMRQEAQCCIDFRKRQNVMNDVRDSAAPSAGDLRLTVFSRVVGVSRERRP